jgi:hypothetical protein
VSQLAVRPVDFTPPDWACRARIAARSQSSCPCRPTHARRRIVEAALGTAVGPAGRPQVVDPEQPARRPCRPAVPDRVIDQIQQPGLPRPPPESATGTGQDASSKPRLIIPNHHIGQLGSLELTVLPMLPPPPPAAIPRWLTKARLSSVMWCSTASTFIGLGETNWSARSRK